MDKKEKEFQLIDLVIKKATKKDLGFLFKNMKNFDRGIQSFYPENSVIYIAKSKYGVFGFIHVQILPNGKAEIKNMSVKRGFKRMGVGRKLFDKAISHFHAKGINWPARVQANSENSAKFYSSHKNSERIDSRVFRIHQKPFLKQQKRRK